MSAFTFMRSRAAPPDRAWENVAEPAPSPGPGVEVTVERPGTADGAGPIRVVRLGRSRFREEITSVGPGGTPTYRLLSGAPVRDSTGSVALDESPDGGTFVGWSIDFRPSVSRSGPLVSFLARRSVSRVLDIAARLR